jgi:hypothetical protein
MSNFASTVFPWSLLLRKDDGGLVDARGDDDGALRVSVVRSELTPVLIEPPKSELVVPARFVPGVAGRIVRRVLVYNTGDNVRTLQLFDSSALPAQGDVPVFIWPVYNAFAAELALGRLFESGLAWAASSTPAVYTPDPAARFWVTLELEPS